MKDNEAKKLLMSILNGNTDMTDSSNKKSMINDKPFSYTYGNPPYQQVITQGNNSSKNVTNVFQNFQLITDIISDNSTLIYPGGRWLNKTGKNMNQLHDTLLTDKHTESIITYPKSEVLFPSCIIVDGISIVNRHMNNTHDTIRMINGNDMNTVYRINANPSNADILLSVNVKTNIIIDKIKKSETNNDDNQAFKALNHYSRAYFNIESDYVSKHDCEPCSSNSPMKQGYVKALTNDSAGVTGRAGWFYVNENDVTDSMNVINDYKIVVASFAINGIHGGSMHTEIINPVAVCGRSRLMIYTTNSKKTANLFMKWFETDIIRFTWASTGMGAGAVGSNTPDFNDFLTNSSHVNIDDTDTVQSINRKLTDYYKLTDDEVDYIHDYVSTLDSFN